jgi:hypothetical protein
VGDDGLKVAKCAVDEFARIVVDECGLRFAVWRVVSELSKCCLPACAVSKKQHLSIIRTSEARSWGKVIDLEVLFVWNLCPDVIHHLCKNLQYINVAQQLGAFELFYLFPLPYYYLTRQKPVP